MGLKDRIKIKNKHKLKRQKKRQKLIKKGLNPDDFFKGSFYIGHARKTAK
ncbi:MAG: hypothetical protein ABIH09_03755 [Candidatus Omnitrophota bacterium]